MSNRLLGIEKDLYEVVMDLWKADKTDAEIAEHINLNYRHPRNQRLISRRTINRVIWRARAAKDPRAIYHGNRNLSPTPREHVAYRKPSSSLFRRKVSEPYDESKTVASGLAATTVVDGDYQAKYDTINISKEWEDGTANVGEAKDV